MVGPQRKRSSEMRKRRLLYTIVLLASIVALIAPVSAVAGPVRKVTGGIGYDMWFFDENVNPLPAQGQSVFAIRELDPSDHSARGWYLWRGRQVLGPEEYGEWLTLRVKIDYVEFLDTDPAEAIICGVVVSARNFPDYICPSGMVGKYFQTWLRDGGTPGSAGDAGGYFPGDCGPGLSCDPCRGDDSCLGPDFLEHQVLRGNLTIRR
jgi:hypothetical protein